MAAVSVKRSIVATESYNAGLLKVGKLSSKSTYDLILLEN